MCGRFTLRHLEKLAPQRFGLGGMPRLPACFNIAPGREIAVIRHGGAGREIVPLVWGLLPHWAEDPTTRFVNARAETAASKRPFKYAYRYRRCLILADGFYEWRTVDGKKQPYFIRLKSDEPFALGGPWERWWKGSEVIESCAILTTAANKLI
jgi:putative SOS response-associated peptidase YedK